MATHLIYGRATNLITGGREIHTCCGEAITEDHPDFAALRNIEPDHNANFFATILGDIPDLCEGCRQEVMSPKPIHAERDNGLTYCGLNAAEAWTGGIPSCQRCYDAVIAEHLRSGGDD